MIFPQNVLDAACMRVSATLDVGTQSPVRYCVSTLPPPRLPMPGSL